MGFKRNVATLLWRTLYLQAVRHHSVATIVELFSVAAIFFLRSMMSHYAPLPLQESQPLPLENISLPQVTAVVYGPNTSYTDSLMKPVIYAVANPNTHPGEDAAKARRGTEERQSVDTTAGPGSKITAQVRTASSADEVRAACLELVKGIDGRSRNRGLGGPGGESPPLCVVFHGDAVSSSGPDLGFDLVLYTSYYHLVSATFELGAAMDPNAEDVWKPAFIYDHFIQESHLELQRKRRNNNDTLPQVTVEALPGWTFERLKNNIYRGDLTLTVFVAFLAPFFLRLSSLTCEFSSGLADYQQIMGLDEREFFVGQFISMLFIQTIESVLGILVLSLAFLHLPKGADGILHNVDVTLVFASFTLFMIGFVLMVMLIACVFPKGRGSFFAAFILAVIFPLMGTTLVDQSLGYYMIMTRLRKLLTAIHPQYGLMETLRIIFIAQDYEGHAGWDVVWRRALGMDNIVILEIWLVMLATDFGMVVLAWYLSKTLPWTSDNPQKPYFFLLPGYWFPEQVVYTEATLESKDPQRFEQMPPEAKPLIVTNELTKVFGSFTALDGIDLVMYENTCTVLLGHNGAGKTTLMSILTGLLGPTSGKARVAGHDVVLNRRLVRKDVSLCPQFDTFFDDLTLWENLVYFVTLRGMRKRDLKESLTATLKSVNLLDKRDNFPKELSGGMRRRLSLAISLATRPKVVILDEPTTGLDPEVRRTIWDTLQAIDKSKTSMLLSTHDMEEADAMADQIIIMANGKVICGGSTAFLKKACNVGYVLTITKAANNFNLGGVMAIVQETAPEAELADDKQHEVTINLKTLVCKNFDRMFEALEKSHKQLGAGSIGVTVASMKDVYIKINLDWVPGGHGQQEDVNEDAVAVAGQIAERKPRFRRRLYAISAKRLIYFTRSWALIALGFLFPIIVVAPVATLLTDKVSTTQKSTDSGAAKETYVPIDLSNLGGDRPPTVLLGGANTSFASQQYRLIIEGIGGSLKVFPDVNKGARELAREGLSNYVRTVAGGAAYEADRVRVLFNPTNMLSKALMLIMVNQAQLRVDSGRASAKITAAYRFVPFLDTSGPEEDGPPVQEGETKFQWLLVTGISLSILVSTFTVMPALERISRARDVQLMSGISGSHYVLCHLIIDFAIYMVVLVPWFGTMAVFASYTPLTLVYIAVILSLFGVVFIFMDYIVAENVTTSGGGMSAVMLLFLVGGYVADLLNGYASFYISPLTRYAFLLFPPFGVVNTIARAVQTSSRAYRCSTADSSNTVAGNASQFSALGVVEKYGVVGYQVPFDECKLPKTPLSFSEAGSLRDIVLIVIEIIVLFTILASMHSGTDSSANRRKAPAAEAEMDPDVAEEKRNVDGLCREGNFSGQTMVVQNIHKFFGDFHAVRGMNFALRPTECFGLLGVNGAGKTTTFQMLAGFLDLSDGEAYAENLKVTANPRQWQSRIGYCFQIDGLLETLNAYEFLYLVGRLRGFEDSDLRTRIDSLITVCDLNNYANRECGGYSGGNKRKLCVAAALLGMPPLVFLDEPYAGVDVVARNKIFKGVDRLKKMSNSTIVLTSHSMEEVEFSCDRLCIMVAGQMKCLGSLQHLRDKFGKGYRFEFMLKHGAGNDPLKLVAAVLDLFPTIKVVETHENVCVFVLEKKMPWSMIFARVAHLEKDFTLEHTLIGENTLEQIFIAFAREGEKATAAAATPVAAVQAVSKTPSPTAASSSASHEKKKTTPTGKKTPSP